MRAIPVGAKGTYTLTVTPAHLASQFKDAALPPVFATPMMVMAMENAALNAVREYLDSGESAVGTLINVRHLAATPAGHQITAQAEVTKVRTMIARQDHELLSFFRSYGMMAGPFQQLELDLESQPTNESPVNGVHP